MMSRYALAASTTLLAVVVFSLGGCTTTETCAKGTVLQKGKCVALNAGLCGAGTVFDQVKGLCVLAEVSGDASGDADETDTTAQDTVADTTEDTSTVDVAPLPDSLTPDSSCTPSCEDRVCGTDGCGGSCGDCPNGKSCDGLGTCIDPPGCFPNCEGKICGSDGCGGTCGSCDDPTKPICQDGLCLAGCVPDCAGKTCGPDGCGSSCGSCDAGQGCSEFGHCVPTTWTCGAGSYAGLDGCQCSCGAADPDCLVAGQPVYGCGPDQLCKADTCEDKVPKGWTCAPFLYDDGLLCNCSCGAPDPDCDDASNFIVDCTVNGCDKKAGACLACVPSCKDKVCGDDGCGGSCGTCNDSKLPGCSAGVCVPQCAPNCQNKECGDDGCGGTCGKCGTDLVCSAGVCAAAPDKSCIGTCGYQTQGGCWCDLGCKDRGDCCGDIYHCFCQPDCTGKSCGDDGCGGTCGACLNKSAPYCNSGACSGTCKPNCDGKACGDDGCGGTCGTCNGSASCTDWGSCVPKDWYCPKHLYNSGGPLSTCDCGCGAPDPDCNGKGPTIGCPGTTKCDANAGVCKADWCSSQGACKAPSWCVGDYPAGDATRKGICSPPDPLGFAPGNPCTTNDSCATGLCVHYTCRIHCQQDAQCPTGQACAGTEQHHPLTGQGIGVANVCHPVGAVGKSCGGNKDCAKGELCLALVEPKTLKPMARCGVPYGGTPEGLPCGQGEQCQVGLLCAAGKCARPCHGGAADCAANQACQPAVLHSGVTSSPDDDVKVPACVSK